MSTLTNFGIIANTYFEIEREMMSDGEQEAKNGAKMPCNTGRKEFD